MKFIFSTTFFLICSFSLHAQLYRPIPQTLLAEIVTSNDVANKVRLYLTLAKDYKNQLPKDTAIAYTLYAERIAREENLLTGMVQAQMVRSEVYIYHKKGAEALKAAESAQQTAITIANSKLIESAALHQAKAYELLRDTAKAATLYRSTIAKHSVMGDSINAFLPYYPLGIIYFNQYLDLTGKRGYVAGPLKLNEMATLRTSMNTLRLSIRSYENADSSYSEELINSYIAIGLVCTYLGETPTDLGYQLKALQLSRSSGKTQSNGEILRAVAEAYETKGEMDKALAYYQKALKIDNEEGNKRGQAADFGKLARTHRKMRQRKEATTYAEQQLAIGKTLNDEAIIKEAQTFLQSM